MDENILRNLHLRKLALGELFGPLTGKPSVDKPFLKYYSEEQLSKSIPKRTMYEDLVEYSREGLLDIAINYYGTKITYKELIENIDKAANAFRSIGVKEGDIVTLCMPFLPETIYSIYGLNKIGAIANVIDPRTNNERLIHYIKECNSEYLVAIDNKKFNQKIVELDKSIKFKNIITVSPTNSMNQFIKTITKINHSEYQSWDSFIKYSREYNSDVECNSRDAAVIIYTSGTSGMPKGVLLSNQDFNAMAVFQKESVYPAERKDKFLLIMPPFIAYGLVIGMHDQLCQGQELIMVPNFKLDNAKQLLPKLIKKHKPQYIMGVPTFLNVLMKSDKIPQHYDLSFLKGFIIGGDSMDPSDERNGNEFLEQHNCHCKITKGWGMTEVSSCATYPKDDECNLIGSVGIPLSGNVIKILPQNEDGIDGCELTYTKEGEIYIKSPTMMLGYNTDYQKQKEVVIYDKDGTPWVRTGDLGYMTENGVLFISNRVKRLVIRPDGHNVSPSQIEQVIISHPDIDSCVVVGIPAENYEHGNWPLACIKVNKDCQKTENELFLELHNLCKLKIPPRDIPNYYEIVDDILFTPNGKIDYLGQESKVKTLKKERKFYN